MPEELQLFWNNLEGTKPPFQCPICQKIYRSLPGIRSHLNEHEINNSPSEKHNISQNLDSNNDFVDLEIDGKVVRLGINEPLFFEKIPFDSNLANTTAKQERKRTIEGGPSSPSSSKIPEVQFRILDDFAEPIIRKIAKTTYYRYVEPSQEELDEDIQYDIDDEDVFWLEELNKLREQDDLCLVSIDTLEWTMDRFEKKWHFKTIHPKQANGEPSALTRDEDALCCICLDGECHQHNTILFCDLCNLAVHQECYGVPHIPDGPWICRRCLISPSKAVSCCLCPSQSGAFKQTDDGRWAHVICALFVPDVGFANPVFLEPIDGVERVAPARWKLTCQVCRKRRVGACIQCHRPTCYAAFHATCAQLAGLHLKLEPIQHLSNTSTDRPERLRSPGLWSGTTAPRRTAYCEVHTSLLHEDQAEMHCEEAHNKRKIVLSILEGNLGQILSIPVISDVGILEMIKTVPGFDNNCSEKDKETFIQRALAYWKLKRKARNGVPLVSTPPSRYVKKFKTQIIGSPIKIMNVTTDDKKSLNEMLLEEVQCCKRVRRELEKVRLLNELIKKRERLKTEMTILSEEITLLKLDPFSFIIKRFYDSLKKNDDDSKILTAETIDFAVIEEKLSKLAYSSIDNLFDDLEDLIQQQIKLHPNLASKFNFVKLKMKNLFEEYKHLIGNQVDASTGLPRSPTRVTKKTLMNLFLKEKCFDTEPKEIPCKTNHLHQDVDDDLSVKSKKGAPKSVALNTAEISLSDACASMTRKSLRHRESESCAISNDLNFNNSLKTNNNSNCTPLKLIKCNQETFQSDTKRLPSCSPVKRSIDEVMEIESKTEREAAAKPGTKKRSFSSTMSASKDAASSTSLINESTPNSPISLNNLRRENSLNKTPDSRTADEELDEFIPLSTSDLVWAKCFGFPWYPAIIIDPKGLSAQMGADVALPSPSAQVLASSKPNHFLVCFFDSKRTWQWLPRRRLDPLGVDSGLDSARLKAGPKAGGSADRKSVMGAYERAIKHRCHVTGESFQQCMAVINTSI